MAIDKMNSKIESFVPSADPGKIQECWQKLNGCLSSPQSHSKDLSEIAVKYGALVGYKCFNYMIEAIYHNYTPSWVDGSAVVETPAQEQEPVVAKPWWA